MAIGIRVKRAGADYDRGASRFFGDPAIPTDWEDVFLDDEIFFAQIRLADIAHLDTENKLPHTGYLYFFIHTEDGPYGLTADVKYYDGEPALILDGFNEAVEEYERFGTTYLMEFSEVGEDTSTTRLLGNPCDWNYEDEPPKLLLQYDPLDNEMGFLDFLDGFIYFFFGRDENKLEEVYLKEEYS